MSNLVTFEDLVDVDALKKFASKASTEEAENVITEMIKILFAGEIKEGLSNVGLIFKIDTKGNFICEPVEQ